MYRAAARGADRVTVAGMDVDRGLLDLVPWVVARAAADTGVRVRLRLKQGDVIDERPPDSEPGAVILANPPFASFGLRGRGTMAAELRKKLSDRFPVMEYKASLFPAFASRFIELAAPGTVVGLVLPDPVISGKFYGRFREWVTRNHRILDLRVMPQEAFKGPSFGHVALLVLQKAGGGDYTFSARFMEADVVKITQNELLNRPGIRWWIPKNTDEYELVKRAIDGPRLSDFVSISSGLIGKHGKTSIVAGQDARPPFLPGISKGGSVKAFKQPVSDSKILFERSALKSGFVKARYFEPKLFIRQTGSRIIAAPDFNNLLCTNNLHVVNTDNPEWIHGLCGVLNSKVFAMLYGTISGEQGRGMAQVDIDILTNLPVPPGGGRDFLKIAPLVRQVAAGVPNAMERLEKHVFNAYFDRTRRKT